MGSKRMMSYWTFSRKRLENNEAEIASHMNDNECMTAEKYSNHDVITWHIFSRRRRFVQLFPSERITSMFRRSKDEQVKLLICQQRTFTILPWSRHQCKSSLIIIKSVDVIVDPHWSVGVFESSSPILAMTSTLSLWLSPVNLLEPISLDILLSFRETVSGHGSPDFLMIIRRIINFDSLAKRKQGYLAQPMLTVLWVSRCHWGSMWVSDEIIVFFFLSSSVRIGIVRHWSYSSPIHE